MQVQSINNAPSFGALKITPEAKAIIEREKGGKYRIKKYTKELENSRWDLRIKTLGKDDIYPYFGNKRETCVIPCHLKDNFVMVYSSMTGGDNDDDITDCLKFSSAERAKEVYDKLNQFFLAKKPNGDYGKTPLQKFDWAVYAMKAFTEAKIIPQKDSPWAHFLKSDSLVSPPVIKNGETFTPKNSPATKKEVSGAEPRKPFITITYNNPVKEKKLSLGQRLSNAWSALLGK